MRLFQDFRWVLVTTVALASGCGSVEINPPVAERGAVVELRAGAAEVTPEFVPENLRNRVGLLGYTQESDGQRTSVALTLENLTTAEQFIFELAALYTDDRKAPLFTTTWERVELLPGKKYKFYSETSDRGAVRGAVLMRQVLELDADTTGTMTQSARGK